MTSTSSAASVLAAFLALAATPAAAGPGNGIRLGGSDGRLHPYLEVEGRWDSNVYFASASTPTPAGTTGEIGDLVLHFRPGVTLNVPGELVSVEADARLDWAQYLGVKDEVTKDLSKLFAMASLGVTVNKRGAIGLDLDDQFRRDPSVTSFLFRGAVISNRNTLSLTLPWRPGGGALIISPLLDWTLETFEPFNDCPAGSADPSCDTTLLGKLGYNDVNAGAEVRWRFLPRTSAVFDAQYFARMPNETQFANDVSGVQARAGISGLVTPHLGATVKLGYADALSSTPRPFRTFLATVEGEWLASEAAKLRLGWQHGFGIEPSTTHYVFRSDRILVGGKYALGTQYAARLDGTWERRAYAQVPDADTADLVWVQASVDAALARWATASVAYAYSTRSSSFSSAAGVEYSKNEAWLRLVFTY